MASDHSANLADPVLARLMTLHPKVIDLTLDRIEHLLDRLGRPERTLPPVIHIAGTNGKGSVLAYLKAIFAAAGYRVHAYSSPHLVRFHERIVLEGEPISDAELLTLLEECEAANGGQPITFFEITTAAAFLAFSRKAADLVILETGLGGRLDATNVIADPALTVITPVSIDHIQYLGSSLAEIAREKAGIIKAGRPLIMAEQEAEAERVIRERAAEVSAPIIMGGRDWQIRREDKGGFVFLEGSQSFHLPRPALEGPHQYRNASLAAAAARHMPALSITPQALAAGIQSARWPARLQRLKAGPLVEAVPKDWVIRLDGGHNAGAGIALADWAREAGFGQSRPKLAVIFGMLETKLPVDFIRPLVPYLAQLIAIRIPDQAAALPAEEAAKAAREAGAPHVEVAKDAKSALDRILRQAALDGRSLASQEVLICGSLYLAGHILATHR